MSATKFKLFQTKIKFLGHEIYINTIQPIDKSIEIASKFSNEIKDRSQLQRFLGSLNYVSDFFPNLRQLCKPLLNRLSKIPPVWSKERTKVVREIKQKIKVLPCLVILNPLASLIVETDALNMVMEVCSNKK